GHPCEILRIELNGFQAGRSAERFACILRGHSNVRNEGGHINKSSDFRVVSRLAYYCTSPGMTDEDDWTILLGDDPTGRLCVVGQRGQRVLDSDDVKAAGFEDWNDFGPTRPVRKRSMNEHDVLYG